MRDKNLIEVKKRGNKEEHKLKLKKNSPIEILVTSILKAGGNNPEYKVDTFRKDLTEKTWELCVDLFIRHAVKKSTFNEMKAKFQLADYITVYDEAFALLSAESNMEVWIHEAERKPREGRDKLRLYVKTGKQTKGKFTHMGWSLKGRERYNEICESITRMRETNESKEKEKWVETLYSENDASRGRKRRSAEMEQWEKEKKKIMDFEPACGFG